MEPRRSMMRDEQEWAMGLHKTSEVRTGGGASLERMDRLVLPAAAALAKLRT
eukprot:CAMPEP_0115301302 /NCGR_PEP_ID=MMETSP0270-20121206/69788_1 /TAXON_ID=71861 /ORGANISM="Scrippsiella trochoidea, Strain CCMP3099" /LENGTH=51 /DNA_ID=CAMNT_0002719175 /DNA_START=100 /DNA_END=256 /DNA_ORIENTATION=-